jgi:hypothetical protein
MRSENHAAPENLGDLKIQARRVDGLESPLRDFPDMSGFESMSYKSFFSEMKENPLQIVDRCQTAFFSLETNFLRQRYELIALIYGFAMIVRDDEAMMRAFLQKPFWKQRSYKPGKSVLRMAFQYCLMSKNGDPTYHRACTYARALSGFFKEDIPMEKIPALIEKGRGIEKLARQNAKEGSDDDDSDAASEEMEEIDLPLDELIDEQEEPEGVPAVPIGGGLNDKRDFFSDLDDGDKAPLDHRETFEVRPPKLNPASDLVLDLTPAFMKKAMRFEEGRRIKIIAVVSGEKGSWRSFTAESLKLLDP